MTDTYSEEYRHACEVRLIASWRSESGRPLFAKMMDYFVGVSERRGAEAAEKLRKDVRVLLESQGFRRAGAARARVDAVQDLFERT